MPSLQPIHGGCAVTVIPIVPGTLYLNMKDHVKPKLGNCIDFQAVKAEIDDYIDYYNNRRYQWHLVKLSPNEFYKFYTTGEYPLEIPNKPQAPLAAKRPTELGNSPASSAPNS